MGKQPAFQFYTGDWMQDTRCLSLAAKGAWIDLLCAMWHSQTRGVITLPLQGYARLIGATVDQTKAVIDELIDMRICDVAIDDIKITEASRVTERDKNVTLINRRMEREAREAKNHANRQLRYRQRKGDEDGDAKNDGDVTPPSSSSSSTTTTKQEKQDEFILPDWIPKSVWDEHRKVRKKKKGALTEYADMLIIGQLEKLRDMGNDPVEVLNKSITGGWTDVYPLKIQNGQQGGIVRV